MYKYPHWANLAVGCVVYHTKTVDRTKASSLLQRGTIWECSQNSLLKHFSFRDPAISIVTEVALECLTTNRRLGHHRCMRRLEQGKAMFEKTSPPLLLIIRSCGPFRLLGIYCQSCGKDTHTHYVWTCPWWEYKQINFRSAQY